MKYMNNDFQRLLWNIAGAEIPILEKCRTDHKKFSVIGATILMTAFIALCAGTSAAWYFTQKGTDDSGNFGWSFLFGLIWAILIFCIDRSLVITLKKDPTKKRQTIIVPLLSRAALAIVVAFMVSIPLELVIFEDYISANEENFEANQISILGRQLKDNSGEDMLSTRISNADSTLNRLGTESLKLEGEINSLQARINKLEDEKNYPNSSEYNVAKLKYNNALQAYNNASANYNAENRKQYPSQSILNKYQSEMSTYQSQKAIAKQNMDSAASNWKAKKQAEIDSLIPQRNSKSAEKGRKDDVYDEMLISRNKDKVREEKVAQEREMKEASKQDKLLRGNHFIRNFQILEYAVWQTDKNGKFTDKTQLMFLWLIRILFFIVEILPTVVKIVSPIGSYERMVYAEEQKMMEYLESDEYSNMIKNIHRFAISSQEKLQQEQYDTEIDLKKSIVEKIKTAQLEVAELAIGKWKEKEKMKFTNKVTSVSKIKDNEDNDNDMVTPI